MAENESTYDWSFLWTTEKDKWFLIYHPTVDYYSIESIQGENIGVIKIRDKDTYNLVILNMINNGVKVISIEEYRNMLPKRKLTLANHLDNIFFRFVQPPLIKMIKLFFKFISPRK